MANSFKISAFVCSVFIALALPLTGANFGNKFFERTTTTHSTFNDTLRDICFYYNLLTNKKKLIPDYSVTSHQFELPQIIYLPKFGKWVIKYDDISQLNPETMETIEQLDNYVTSSPVIFELFDDLIVFDMVNAGEKENKLRVEVKIFNESAIPLYIAVSVKATNAWRGWCFADFQLYKYGGNTWSNITKDVKGLPDASVFMTKKIDSRLLQKHKYLSVAVDFDKSSTELTFFPFLREDFNCYGQWASWDALKEIGLKKKELKKICIQISSVRVDKKIKLIFEPDKILLRQPD